MGSERNNKFKTRHCPTCERIHPLRKKVFHLVCTCVVWLAITPIWSIPRLARLSVRMSANIHPPIRHNRALILRTEEASGRSKALIGLPRTRESHMREPLFLLLPFVLAATRSLALGIQSLSRAGARPLISAETEHHALRIIIFGLIGLLVTLFVMTRFPHLGAVMTEYNQI